jgi:glucoamylase
MEAQTNFGGLIPEQVWDGPDIPGKGLYSGRPSGSAMPLVWAHAEYVKLLRSLKDGRVFDTPPQTVRRYVEDGTSSPRVSWRFNEKCRFLPRGKSLRVEMLEPATVHWSTDDWRTATDVQTSDSGIGVFYVDLPTEGVPVGSTVIFTFFWPRTNGWEGSNFSVEVKGAADETSFGSPSGPVSPPRGPSPQQPMPGRRQREQGPRRHP